jgi:hypothetical protein
MATALYVEEVVGLFGSLRKEGHINRLKTLKRQMYGRAGFELLRLFCSPLLFSSPFVLHQT